MLKTIIVEDEYAARLHLTNTIANHFRDEIEILEICDNIKDAEKAILKHRPDFIFLDIHVKNATGFDLLEKFDRPNFEVVFVTGYDKYAIRAFDLDAIHYIIKPIRVTDLQEAITRINRRMGSAEQQPNFAVTKKIVDNELNQIQILTISYAGGELSINIPNILYCQADGNYTWFFCNKDIAKNPMKAEPKNYHDSRTLKKYDDFLLPYGFCRVHDKYLVNLAHVAKPIIFGSFIDAEQMLTLKNGKKIPVSDKKKKEFLKRMKEL